MFGSEIGHAQRMFERGAGRDDLLENALQYAPAERPGLSATTPIDHLPLARRLINRRAVIVLEMADLLRESVRAR